MEVIDRLSLQKPFQAGSLDRISLESIHQASSSRVLPLDVKYAVAQSKQLADLYNVDQDDEGEIMLLAMILLQLHGVKLPVDVNVDVESLNLSVGGEDIDTNESEEDALNKKKRQRTSPDQLAILEHIFQTDKMPNQQTRVQLADQLGMSSRRVQIWFQNKRAKVKRSNLKPGECESPSDLNMSSSSISPSSSPSSPVVVPQQDSSSPLVIPTAPSSPAAVVPQIGNPLKRSFSQIEAPMVPSSASTSTSLPASSPSFPSSSSTVPVTIVVKPSAPAVPLNTIIETTTKQLKAQQLFSPLTSPFTDTQPVLTASY